LQALNSASVYVGWLVLTASGQGRSFEALMANLVVPETPWGTQS
jgi:hypothetical protein